MRRKSAFTLVELLCVLTIILILIGLMLGPIFRAYRKAKNFGWENDGYQLADRFTEKMRQHFGSAPEYPALTVDQLYEGGMIDSGLRSFLKDRRVQFVPFSSRTPETAMILHVTLSKSSVHVVHKQDILPKE